MGAAVQQSSVKRWSLRLAIVLVLGTAIAVLVQIGILGYFRLAEAKDYSEARRTSTGMWVIQYGVRWNRLAYLAITANTINPDDVVVGMVSTAESLHGSRATLSKPDGQVITLPGDVMIYQDIDGSYREIDMRLSLEQLRAFLNAKPQSYSVDELKSFLQSQPR